jgi:8-oxo-dGTP pyrophosphatase MutT (NUDIX family)
MKDMTIVCIIFAQNLWDGSVLLIEKKKPPWQQGRLNLPGGKIEVGETPVEGASRELYEETGILVLPEQLTYVARFNLPVEGSPKLYVYAARIPAEWSGMLKASLEPVRVMSIMEAIAHPRLIDNLRYIIPRALCVLDGYTEEKP